MRDLPIRSYTLELVTIYAARSIGKVSTDPLFKKVMELLRGCPSLRIAFDDNYVSAQYTGYGYYNSYQDINLLRSGFSLKPIVMQQY